MTPAHAFPRPHPPIHLGQFEIAPLEYIVHQHSQACTACGRVNEWSAVYAHNRMRSRTGLGKPIDNLSPVEGFLFNIPIKRLEVGERYVPTCFECSSDLSLSHLPTPPSNITNIAAQLADTDLVRNSGPAATSEKPKGSTKVTRTLDDIL